MKRLALFLAAIIAAAFLSASFPVISNSSPASAANDLLAVSTTLNPVADAYVYQSSPTTNYGSATALRVDGSPIQRSFLRFNVPLVSGTITKATLRIYANSSQSTGYTVSRVASNAWSESTITYGNAPAIGSAIGASGPAAAGTWTAVDVTSYVTANGTYSFALTTANTTALSLASREATNKPQLVIVAGSSATATPTRTATAKPSATATKVPPTATNVPPTATATMTAVPPTATPAGTNYQPAAPIRAAFFYPWFPQAWTQQGIFPFTNYHPSLGWYSSTDDAIIDTQLTLALQAHLDAFIASWWGQGQHTDTAFQYILNRSERAGSPYQNMRWAIYYENESLGDPSSATILNDLQYLAAKALTHPGYLKVNGKPVVFVYADANDACGMADRWVQAKNAFGGNVYIVLKVFPGYLNCASQPDSWHQYSPAVGFDQQGKLSAAAAPGFWLKGQPVRLVRDPVRFESDVKKVVASGAFWQLITTWNEWGEGTSVEPATEWGNTYIDILSRNLPIP